MEHNKKDSRISRFKATSLSGKKKYHGKKLQESIERQRSNRSDAITAKRGNLPGNLIVDDAGMLRGDCLSKLVFQLESSTPEEVEYALRCLCQFCVEGGNLLAIVQLLPLVCRVYASTAAIFVPTGADRAATVSPSSQSYRIAGYGADILATFSQESEECCFALFTTCNIATDHMLVSLLFRPMFLVIKSFVSAPHLSEEFCSIVVQNVRFLGGLIRFGPMDILNFSFLSEVTIILRQVLGTCSYSLSMSNIFCGISAAQLEYLMLTIQDEALWCFVYLSARAPFSLVLPLLLNDLSFGDNKDTVDLLRTCLVPFKSVIENGQLSQSQQQWISFCVSSVLPITRITANILSDRECSSSVLERLLPVTADVSSIFWHLNDAYQNSQIAKEINLKTLSLSIWRMWQCIVEDFVSRSLPMFRSVSQQQSFFYDGPGTMDHLHKSNPVNIKQKNDKNETAVSVSSIVSQLQSLLWHCFASDVVPTFGENDSLRLMSVVMSRMTNFCFCVTQAGHSLEEAPDMLHSVLHVCYLLAMSLHSFEMTGDCDPHTATHIATQVQMLRHFLLSSPFTGNNLNNIDPNNINYQVSSVEESAPLFSFLKEIFSNGHGNSGSFANSIRCDYSFVETTFFLLQLSLFVLDHCYQQTMKHEVLQIMVSLDVAENIELLQYSGGVNEDVACLAEQLLEQIYACMEMEDNERYK